MSDGRTVSRRALLLAGGALFLGACSTAEPPASAPTTAPGANSTRTRIPRSTPAEPSATVDVTIQRPSLPDLQPWRPTSNEIQPEAKLAAARVIEALGTTTEPDGVADRLRAVGAEPRLADQAGALVPPAAPAVAEIIYPQYGGLTRSQASIMTIARQTWVEGGQMRSRTVTADLRVSMAGDGWAVTEIKPVEPTELSTRSLTSKASELASRSGVDLPDAALVDLAAGVVDDMVLDALLSLASHYQFSVSVFRAGHPDTVFGTNRTSNHTRGRAVDIWAINRRPVVTMGTDDQTLLRFLEAARDVGSDEIGGPIDPDGPGGAHFTDHVHRDHVHIGFEV